MHFPETRLRRLRRSPALRNMVRETHVTPHDFIYPMFVEQGATTPTPIDSMPGIQRVPEAGLAAEVKRLHGLGVQAVMLFGVSQCKDATGSDSLKNDGLLARMLHTAKGAVPEMVVIADNCFCEYTDHGHCGIVGEDGVDNDATLENLATQALVCARAGADMLAPSAMMDGQIAIMRDALDAEGYDHLPLMAYASKFASGFYGPFRAAAGCALKGDRKQYQMDPANGREALREAEQDEAEGADILMVKPGLPYLDVLARLRTETDLPLAVYNVSGEYAMLKFAAQAGAIDEEKAMLEMMTCFKRAGADVILSYFAPEVCAILQE